MPSVYVKNQLSSEMANASEASHGSATRPDPEDVIRVCHSLLISWLSWTVIKYFNKNQGWGNPLNEQLDKDFTYKQIQTEQLLLG